MKTLLYAFVFASLIFFIIDFIWLSIAVKAFYKPHIGSLLNDKPIIWAAIVFYLIYSIGLSLLVLKPGLVNESLFQVFLNGVIFAAITGAIVQLWFKEINLSILIAVSMILNMIVAGLFGILVPVTLKKMKIDPAIASSVFVTTITDVIGFLSFLGIGAYFFYG